MGKTVPLDHIQRFFGGRGKHVIAFAGFGELGYQDPTIVDRVVRSVLAAWEPHQVLVTSGTLCRANGHDGIAAVYAIAHGLGFGTAGIHPSVALSFAETHYVSAACEHVFWVEDSTWGGYIGGTDLSPTLRAVLAVADELVVIGGGKHAADELEAFCSRGKRVRYFAAEMNHQFTNGWCARSGVRITDYRGAAHTAWTRVHHAAPVQDGSR
jgi:hypothetical protein